MVVQAIAVVVLIVLGASGIAKIINPAPTAGALKGANLPSSESTARALGITEVAASGLGLVLGGLWLAPASLIYAGFGGFVLYALRARVPLQSCGCFGNDDTPPTRIHLVFNVVAAVSLAIAASSGSVSVPWRSAPQESLLYIGLAGIGAYLSYQLLALLPSALGTSRRR